MPQFSEAGMNGIILEESSSDTMFHSLIKKLHDKAGDVVILLDEYDKPILNNISNEKVSEFLSALKVFYSVIKEKSGMLRFAFITGVSKFCHVSLFSDLNNLTDITMDAKYATMLGYTEDAVWFHEIGHSFGFVDEYGDFEKDASAIYRSSERPILSIMQARLVPDENSESKFTGAVKPSCEDAEGLINLIDAWTVRLKKKRHPEIWLDLMRDEHERILGGWKSFEFGLKDFYLLGASVHKLFENRKELSPEEVELVEAALRKYQNEGGTLQEDERAFLYRNADLVMRNAFRNVKRP